MHKLLAIARLTIKEFIRTKIAIAFVLLLIGFFILISSTATGDGTLVGKIQMIISYSSSITVFLVSLLSILLASRAIDIDIKTMRIETLITKPVKRWQIILGRWSGTVLLAVVLTSLAFIAIYILVYLNARSAKPNSEEWIDLHNHLLVARRPYSPEPIPNLEEKVEEIYKKLKQEGRLPPPEQMPPSQVKKLIREGLLQQPRTVGPRQIRTWKIKTNLKKSKLKVDKALLTVRFKYEPSKPPPAAPEHNLHTNTILGYWIIGRKESTKNYYWPPEGPQEKPTGTAIQFDVPIDVVENDGSIYISFVNIDPRDVAVHFPLKEGLEILVREDTFENNLIRYLIIIFSSIIFLVSVGTFCGTFLSFPVAALLSLSVFFIGISSDFLAEAIGLPYGLEFGKNIIENIEKIITYIAIKSLPSINIGQYTSNLIDGIIIDWPETLTKAFWLGLDSLVLLILAFIIFNRREIAKVIV